MKQAVLDPPVRTREVVTGMKVCVCVWCVCFSQTMLNHAESANVWYSKHVQGWLG